MSRAGFHAKREREREEERTKLLSVIYGVSLVRVHRAKSESSSTQRGLRVGIKNVGFCQRFEGGFGKSKISGSGSFPPMLLHYKR